MEISKIGCYVRYDILYTFSFTKDSLIEVDFQSFFPKEYYYKKNEVAKYYKDSTKAFLKRNNIKLGQHYLYSQKPLNSHMGYSEGIDCYISYELIIDSTNFYNIEILSELDNLYDLVIMDNFTIGGIKIAGEWTQFNFYLNEKDKKTEFIKDKKFIGWYDFHFKTKKVK